MTDHGTLTRNFLGKSLVFGAVLAIASAPAMARGGGGGGMGGNMGAMGGMNAQSNMSRMNANNPTSPDRDFGQDRASDRTPSSRTDSSTGSDASALGGLNADHSSATARTHASSTSRVGEIATYQDQMDAALAIQDPAKRNAAIVSARQQLAQSSNKPLTSSAIASLDKQLNIQGASPTLGASK